MKNSQKLNIYILNLLYVVLVAFLVQQGACQFSQFSSKGCRSFTTRTYLGSLYTNYILDANNGSWPGSGFCSAFSKDALNSSNQYDYKISTQLFNKIGPSGVDSGNLGLLYNAKNEKNYDFVYFRLHSLGGCFQTGYTVNGVPTFTNETSAYCPGQNPPKGAQWFDVRIEVNDTKANIYLAGKFVREVTPHYPTKGQGGVLVANGFRNVAHFRNFDINYLDYSLTSCIVATSGPSGSHFVLDANHKLWPDSGFCSALSNYDTLNSNQYQISAQLFNKIGPSGINSGNLGLLYNAIDRKNYDFVYFRLHSSTDCFQTGYTVNGVPTFTYEISAFCSGQNSPKGAQWFDVHIDVINNKAKIYLAGKFVKEVIPHYPAKGQGGVLVANGYKNVAYFRNFDITHVYSLTSCVSASSGPSGSHFVLDANHGSWPTSGFCSALNDKDTGNSSQYLISAQLFNRIGPSGVDSGHLGLLYNAKDGKNFDFVYFRPHNLNGCFQTGYTTNGVPTISKGISASCPGQNPPKGAQWFDVRIEVNDTKAKIYLSGKLVSEVIPHYPVKGQGGVLVANGYRNVAYFRNFDLSDFYTITSCVAANTGPSGNYFVLDANQGSWRSWPGIGFCSALSNKDTLNSNKYEISAQLFNKIGWDGVDSGHLGLLYNAKDEKNYDFVYFRPRDSRNCFTTSYTMNGVPQRQSSYKTGPCPGQSGPKGREWFDVRIEVDNDKAKIYLAGKFVIEITPHYAAKGRGGVLVANGFGNIAYFRNFKIPHVYSVTSCVASASGPSGSYFVLDANHGSWPTSGFCSALNNKNTLNSSQYQISAQLFNKIGPSGVDSGHLGLLYNAKDEKNYDFVYFRLHSLYGCFQTGYTMDGVPTISKRISGSCPRQNPPKGAHWFDVRIEVNNNNKARIYLAGKFVREVTPHYPVNGHGGVLVANGYKNVAYFRNFDITHIYSLSSCVVATSGPSGSYFVLDANHSIWPAGGFCSASKTKDTVSGKQYEISAQLFNKIAWSGVNSGHLGLLYNAIDEKNYDYVFFRPQSSYSCFETGYVLGGSPVFNDRISASCPGQNGPKGAQWFDVRIEVNNNKAKIYLAEKFVREIVPHYPARGQGGVLVANGYENVAYFRNYKIAQVNLAFSITSCVVATSGPSGDYFVLDANHGSWPASGFCSALNEEGVWMGSRYVLSAQLFNKIGPSGVNSGNLGLLYNAKDEKNYDFVYFRVTQQIGCFQTGYTVNGVPTFTYTISTGFCQYPRLGAQWFDVRIEVVDTKANIYLAGEFLKVVIPHYPAKGQGGVLVANGYKNVAYFKNYKICSS